MRKSALALTFTVIALVGCSTAPKPSIPPPAAAAVTDLGTVAVNNHDWYQCTLSGARTCRVRLTALPNDHVLVEVVVLSQDAQGQPQRILARSQTETDLGKKVSFAIGDGSVSLTPQITPRAKL